MRIFPLPVFGMGALDAFEWEQADKKLLKQVPCAAAL